MTKKAVVLILLIAFVSGFAGFIVGVSTPAVIAATGDYDHLIARELKKIRQMLDSRLRRIETAIDNQ